MEEPPIWTSGATTLKEESISFVFGDILLVNSLEKIEIGKKKIEAFLKFLNTERRLQRRRKSLIMTLENYYLFIDAVISRDTWPVSRDRSSPDMWKRAQNANLVFKENNISLAPPDTWQHTLNASLAFNRTASLQQREVRVYASKSASLQQSKSRVSTSKTATLQYSQARVLAKQENCTPTINRVVSLQQSESCVSTSMLASL